MLAYLCAWGRGVAGKGGQRITKLTKMHSTYYVPGTVLKFYVY